jgi:predicted phage terminase large subunit-like protein
VAELLTIKGTIGAKAWAAQYQGNPVPEGGSLLKTAWWPRYATLPAAIDRVEVTLDSAYKTGVSADWSAAACWARCGADAYLVKAWRRRVEYPELVTMAHEVQAWAQMCFPGRFVPLVIEDAASGQSLLQTLRRSDVPVIAHRLPPGTSKVSRVEAVSPLIEAGRVHIPQDGPETAAWLGDWLTEHSRFPYAEHDDWVDTTAIALSRLLDPLGHADSLLDRVVTAGIPRREYSLGHA